MEGFVQIGVTALRDPKTRDFLDSVPLYIRAEDYDSQAVAGFDTDIARVLAGKFKQYMEGKKND